MCLQGDEADSKEKYDKKKLLALETSTSTSESKLIQNRLLQKLWWSDDNLAHLLEDGLQSKGLSHPEEYIQSHDEGWGNCIVQSLEEIKMHKPKEFNFSGIRTERSHGMWMVIKEEQQETHMRTSPFSVAEVGGDEERGVRSGLLGDEKKGCFKWKEMDESDGCFMVCNEERPKETDSKQIFGCELSSMSADNLDSTQSPSPFSLLLSTSPLPKSQEFIYDNPLLPPLLPERAAFLSWPPNVLSGVQLCCQTCGFPSVSCGLTELPPCLYFLSHSGKSTASGSACLPECLADHKYEKRQQAFKMSSGKTILVTGGAGYIGSHSVIELIDAGYDIVVIDNLVNASMESVRRVEKIVGKQIPSYNVDLLNKPALEEIFKKHKISAVIHFAGLKAVGESCELPLLYYKTNVGGTTNLLEVMEANGVFNLVFSSSATVYGTPQFLPLTEDHPVGSCTNPYGKSKYMIEQILQDISSSNKKWNIVILRYFNPVGSHKSGTIGEDPQGIPNNLMPYIAQVAVGRREFLSVYGSDYDTPDGTGVRDYIHVVDLAQGHVAAVRKLDEQCGLKIYNLGTGQGYSVLDMVKAFEKASGKKIAYKLVDRRPGDVASCFSDPALAAKELGWTAKKGLDEMCEDLWRWQSQNPQGFKTEKN